MEIFWGRRERNLIFLCIFAAEMKGARILLRAALWLLPTLLPLLSQGQYITLWHNNKGSSLQFNPDRLWSYNLYEHSRWGGGLKWTLAPRRVDGSQVSFDGHVGYGVQDRQWKGGIGNEIRDGRSPYGLVQYITVGRDYVSAGSRHMAVGSITDPASLAAFMSRRMYDRAGLVWGYRWRVRGVEHCIDATLFAGSRLFDNERLLYRVQGDTLAEADGMVLRWTLHLPQGFTSQVEAGGTWPNVTMVARLLAQYDRKLQLSPVELSLYLQGGITPPRTSYLYMFDLGGTFGAPLYFRNSLLTARPNEFTANTFVFLSLHLGPEKPLWHWWSSFASIGTSPKPFVALDVAWGWLWGQDANGRLTWEGLDLQATHLGIIEALAGVDGLVRWGAVDWGIAAGYRLTHPSAPYHLTQIQDNLALLITAALIF